MARGTGIVVNANVAGQHGVGQGGPCGVNHRQGADIDVGNASAVCEGIARRIVDTRDQGGFERCLIDSRLPALPGCDGVGQGAGVAGARPGGRHARTPYSEDGAVGARTQAVDRAVEVQRQGDGFAGAVAGRTCKGAGGHSPRLPDQSNGFNLLPRVSVQ